MPETYAGRGTCFLLLLHLLRAFVAGQNVSLLQGSYCSGRTWNRWKGFLWRLYKTPWEQSVSGAIRSFPGYQEVLAGFFDCPEGVASAQLAFCARGTQQQKQNAMRMLAQGIGHFHAPVLLWRLQNFGWPDFDAAHVLSSDVHRQRWPKVADALLDTTPHFAMVHPPAPEVIQQAWWWSKGEVTWDSYMASDGWEKESSMDLGMHVILQRSPLLTQRPGLLLIDVGAFDGNSLLSVAVRSGMNHSILAFEPLSANRKMIYYHFIERGLLSSLPVLNPDTPGAKKCVTLDMNFNGHPFGCQCPQRGGFCAALVDVGLSAGDHEVPMATQGAHSSATMHTHAGVQMTGAGDIIFEATRFRRGAPIVKWWVNAALGQSCVDVHLLKIDVEGSEFAVLRGLEPLFAESRVRFLFLEFWPVAIMTWGSDPLGVLRWLSYYGFLCRFLGTHSAPESFEDFIARHTAPEQMSDYKLRAMSFNDIICENIYWNDPCGFERSALAHH
eukprot:TRINITY_DN28508_c0_g1_i1.p1 TRINITY_DN28508_c0_g1~~TRINITY_DN28508_c0_g1_i1.p1  ORF type:complete len:498 (+),score=73.89 TRINITY_DN28508_c0_g1_i1:112-1605(+)